MLNNGILKERADRTYLIPRSLFKKIYSDARDEGQERKKEENQSKQITMAATALRDRSSLLWLWQRTRAAVLRGPGAPPLYPSISRGYSAFSRHLRPAIERVQTSPGVRFGPRATTMMGARFAGLSSTRGYADLKPPPGKTEADLLVEEIEELYVLAHFNSQTPIPAVPIPGINFRYTHTYE